MSGGHPDDADSVARYLVTHDGGADLTDDERTWLDTVRTLLTDEAIWTDPPPELADAVVQSIERHPSVARPRTGRAPRARRTRNPVAGSLAAVAAVIAAVIIGGRLLGPADGPHLTLAGTELAPAATGTATVRDTPSGVAITLRVNGLEPPPPGCYYQAWVAGPDGSVPIGTFHVRDGDGEPIDLWSGVAMTEYPNLTVTVECTGGDPASSGRRVLAGRLG
jgi:hypothetical protein